MFYDRIFTMLFNVLIISMAIMHLLIIFLHANHFLIVFAQKIRV
jgi:hypothetical protein